LKTVRGQVEWTLALPFSRMIKIEIMGDNNPTKVPKRYADFGHFISRVASYPSWREKVIIS
jgi:hypothetical protein